MRQLPTGSQRRPGAIELIEKTINWRKPPVALDDDRQWLRSKTAELGQQREHFRGYVVQVVMALQLLTMTIVE
jgi:hypothetical protein